MRVYMLWHGGSSYSPGSYEDIEEFRTLDYAKGEFKGRFDGEDSYYPAVDETCEAWIWFKAKPKDEGDLYPDAIMRIGPHGAVKVDPA